MYMPNCDILKSNEDFKLPVVYAIATLTKNEVPNAKFLR